MTIVVALGANMAGNLGAPRRTLTAALELLEERGVGVKRRSSWWRTPAWPPGSGPDFVNGAALVATTLEPQALLAELHAVEAALGRARRGRWRARVADLDLITYGQRVLPDDATARRWMALPPERAAETAPQTLILPHPRLHERGFVLAPMAELAPDWRHPLLGLTTAEMLALLPPNAMEGVERMEQP